MMTNSRHGASGPGRVASAVAATLVLAAAAFAQESPRRMVLVRERALSAPEGASSLSDVADVAVGRDETAYVVQAQERSVRVFRPDGRVGGSLGRGGRGPGEFQRPEMAGWRGDTLVISDPYAYRLAGFLRDGRTAFTRTYAIEGFLPRAVLANGSTLGYRIPLSKAIVEGTQTSTELLAATGARGPARVLARLPMRHHTARVVIGSGEERSEAFFPQPFGDADLFDVDPMGRWIVSVSRPVPTGQRGVFSLTWRGPDGAVLRSVRVPYPSVALPQSMLRDTLEHYTGMFVRAFPGVPRARLGGYVREAVFTPAYLPPVTAIASGMDGTTWVRRGGAGNTVTWMVFSAQGTRIAVVTAPADVNIVAATARAVWASSKDMNDVPTVTRFAIRREGRR